MPDGYVPDAVPKPGNASPPPLHGRGGLPCFGRLTSFGWWGFNVVGRVGRAAAPAAESGVVAPKSAARDPPPRLAPNGRKDDFFPRASLAGRLAHRNTNRTGTTAFEQKAGFGICMEPYRCARNWQGGRSGLQATDESSSALRLAFVVGGACPLHLSVPNTQALCMSPHHILPASSCLTSV